MIKNIQQLSDSIQDNRLCNHIDAELLPDELADLNLFNLEQIEYCLEKTNFGSCTDEELKPL